MLNSLLIYSLSTVVKDKNDSANVLSNDPQSISTWDYNWKMLFNQMLVNRLKKCYFQEKRKFKIIQP